MFTDEILEKILADEEVQKCPVGTQATMIHAIERILEEEQENNEDDALH